MKKVLSSLVCAWAAIAFAGAVWAADYPATDTTQGGTDTSTMQNDNGTMKKKTKKAKKKKSKKAKRTGGSSGMGTGGGTGPHYGTPNLGGPSGNELGQPQNQPQQPSSGQ